MDAEFNMMNKHVGRRTLAHAEKAEVVAPDQYGSQKYYNSRKAILNKVLLNEIILQKRIAAALGMNNARSCYDHIVHLIAILVLMSFGVAGKIAQPMFKVLQEGRQSIIWKQDLEGWNKYTETNQYRSKVAAKETELDQHYGY